MCDVKSNDPMRTRGWSSIWWSGWEAAASTKWLTNIRVSEAEAPGFFMQTAYRIPNRPVAPGASVDPKDMVPYTALDVKSIFTYPLDGATMRTGTSIELRGFAWAGEADITLEVLKKARLIKGKDALIKVLGDGELKSAITVRAHKFSKTAQEKITKAGGKAEILQ